jgi:hypothetical protein
MDNQVVRKPEPVAHEPLRRTLMTDIKGLLFPVTPRNRME